MKEFIYNNTKIVVGQSAQENWDMIEFDTDKVWLHLNSFPSCHVIIDDIAPNEDTIIYAARLCKDYTKYRNLKNVKVCYTKCSNLIKGTDVGSVIYKSKRKVDTIIV
jgi:predicted ribosome quality control (RQC) complex YloA/Tae2 family protein